MRGLLHVQVELRRSHPDSDVPLGSAGTEITQPPMRGLLHVQVELRRSRAESRIRPVCVVVKKDMYRLML